MEIIKRQETVRKHRFTVEEFHKMGEAGIFGEDDRVELIDGEVVEMSPIGWRHVWSVNALTMLLATQAQGRYVVSVQNPLTISEHGQPQPDLVLVQDLPPGRLPTPADSLLAVEVSDSSLAYDRNIKLPRYAEAGVPEVWILNLQANSIEVHSDPAPDGYRKTIRNNHGEKVESATIPGLAFDASEALPPKDPEA